MALVSTHMGRWLAPLTQGIAVLLLLANTLLWLLPEGAEFVARNFAALRHEPITLTPVALGLGWAISSLQLGILAVGLWAMAQVFRLFAQGEHFHPGVGGYVYRFGKTLLLLGVAGPLFRTLMVLAVTFANPPGQKLLIIGFSTNELIISLVGLLLVMLGYVLQEAAAIAADNRQII